MLENVPRIYDVFRKFKPEWAVFVIADDRSLRRPSGMIAGWSMKCSREPPLYAVSLSKEGYTGKLIRDTGEFVVAVPNKELEPAIRVFGRNRGDAIDKFKESGIKTRNAKIVSAPLLEDATINLECVLEKEVDSGDHTIFIGRVVAAYHNPEKKFMVNIGNTPEGWYEFKEF